MNPENITSESLESRLQSLYESLGFRRIFAGFFVGTGITLLLLWLILLMESWLWMSPAMKTILLSFAFSAGLISALILYIRIPRPDFRKMYTDFSVVSGMAQIRYILDLSRTESTQRSGLHDAAIDQQLDSISNETFLNALKSYRSTHPINSALQVSAFIIVSGLVLFGGFAAIEKDALGRISAPGQTFYQPNPFLFSIVPGDSTIEQGSGISISAQFESGSDIPDNVQLVFRTSRESQYRIQRMELMGNNRFSSTIQEFFDDTRYYLTMDGFRTDEFNLQVQLLPRFTELKVTVQPPSYTRLDSTTFTYPFSRIEAYPGSMIRVQGVANQLLNEISVYSRLHEEPTSMQLDGQLYVAEFESSAERDSLWFVMRNENELENRNRFNFELQPLTDAYPEVRLIRPDPILAELEPESLELLYEMRDDFGFSRVILGYYIRRSYRPDEPERGSIRLPVPSDRIAVDSYTWQLGGLRLLPFDELVYWIEVYDNDTYNEFKQSRSAEHSLTVRSLTDYLLAQEEREDDVANRLQSFQENYEQNRRDFEDLRQQIIQNEGDNWDQSQAAEQIRQAREDLASQLDEIKDQFEQLKDDLSADQQLTEQTRSMYEDLQRLIDEIDDPEILEAMKRLQEGLENMDRNQVRDALQQIEFDEERYQQRLERTLELFRNLQMNAELDRMNAMLDDMARQEEGLIGEELPDTQEQQRRQEQIREDLNQLRERMETLPERSSRRNREDIARLNEQLQEQMSAVDEQLGEDVSEMQDGGDGSSEGSQQRRQEIRDQLDAMRQQVQQSQSMMGQESIRVNRQALLGIMQNLLLLSDAQESLVLRTGELSQGSAAFIEVAREQRVISRTFSIVADSLYRVSAEIPRFPNLINDRKAIVQRHLNRAIELLAERDRNRSVAEERTALGGINEIASLLADLLDQLDDSGGGDGSGGGMSAEQLMDQLQKLSGEQAELNQMIQDMINDMAGERLMQDQMERLDQMARQQNEIRRQLQQIQRQGGLSPGDDLMSELQRLSEEMEEAINDLRGGVVEERVIVQRQQNILSRMLQAERALNERDEDEERRGDQPEPIERISPSELTLEALREQIRRRLQSSDETRFTDEYQMLIQRYFEILEEEERRRDSRNR